MIESENIIGVIQARMSSYRLPGKVMADIVGKPLIWHIVERLKQVKFLSNVVIATTDKDYDKPLREFADEKKIPYFAGSENDILDRMYKTGIKFRSTAILKINADCPLIDSSLINLAVQKYLNINPKPDLIINSPKKSYPVGLGYSLFNFKTIEALRNNLTDIFWREFMYMYIIENKNKFSIVEIENDEDLSTLRWTVDFEDDLKFVRKVYENLYPKNKFFEMSDVLSLLKEKPEIKNINAKHSSELGLNSYEKLKKQHNE